MTSDDDCDMLDDGDVKYRSNSDANVLSLTGKSVRRGLRLVKIVLVFSDFYVYWAVQIEVYAWWIVVAFVIDFFLHVVSRFY